MPDIVQHAISSIEVLNDNGLEKYQYNKQSIDSICKELGKFSEPDRFRQALLELLGFSIFLKEEKHDFASKQLSDLVLLIIEECFPERVDDILNQGMQFSKNEKAFKHIIAQKEEIFEEPDKKTENSLHAQELAAHLRGKLKIGR